MDPSVRNKLISNRHVDPAGCDIFSAFRGGERSYSRIRDVSALFKMVESVPKVGPDELCRNVDRTTLQ